MPRVLEVRDLVTKFYTVDGVAHAVNGVSFDLDRGETLAIVGESGSGKSVTVMSILGLIASPPGKVESGTALFHSPNAGGEWSTRDLLRLSQKQLRDVRGGEIGFVFQDPISSLNPLLTIGEQITESLVRHENVSREAARRRTVKLLASVGIPDPELRYNAYPFQFSGGMRQRVMIAIAIACNPQIVIADEPTTALDVTVQAQVVDLFKQLRSERDISIIWITHDLGVVAGLAHRVLIMYGGRVAEVGLLDDVYDTPRHPYTIGLLGALPRLDSDEARRLVGIEGTAPDLLVPPTHCPFAARCHHAFEPCWVGIPPLIQVGPGHMTACFYDLEKGGPRDA